MNCDVLLHPQLLYDLLTARHEDALLVAYQEDDAPLGDEEMKVRVRRGRVVDISKTMAGDDADGENVGVVKFGADGARLLTSILDAAGGRGRTARLGAARLRRVRAGAAAAMRSAPAATRGPRSTFRRTTNAR